VKRASQLANLNGLIIPGGESTTIGIFLEKDRFGEQLREWIRETNHLVWGTCAGLILLANKVERQKKEGQSLIGGLDICVDRNGYGRQVQSFEATISLKDPGLKEAREETWSSSKNPPPTRGVFIRAPIITEFLNPSVTVLADLSQQSVVAQEGGEATPTAQKTRQVVAVQQGNIIATTFHPELTPDETWHFYFLSQLRKIMHNSSSSNNNDANSEHK